MGLAEQCARNRHQKRCLLKFRHLAVDPGPGECAVLAVHRLDTLHLGDQVLGVGVWWPEGGDGDGEAMDRTGGGVKREARAEWAWR